MIGTIRASLGRKFSLVRNSIVANASFVYIIAIEVPEDKNIAGVKEPRNRRSVAAQWVCARLQ